MVQNKTEKVQSVLAEKIENNKKETELELGNIVQKLETKLEESFKALSEKVVSFMVNSMVEIYEKLDRKNADKVYSILSKESVDCFNIQLHPISPPLSPSTSVETSVSQVDIPKAQNKPKKPPITQKVAPPRSRKPQNGTKNEFRTNNYMTMSFVVMLGHSSLSGLLINMTMSFVVMLGHVSLSGLLTI